ncbi:hypothetical protein GGU10DRAFT_364478 [Lentinula aff. detonsa]|uniref:Uncharacterized protein n=1 Tax=Lentinula aff. detonsa TaxID=2804958 RepID=A0AA38NK96_9AGAR|nr:hypothetical protein GGU10DRAFT_364478 [Lentinula aff. detonsa]
MLLCHQRRVFHGLALRATLLPPVLALSRSLMFLHLTVHLMNAKVISRLLLLKTRSSELRVEKRKNSSGGNICEDDQILCYELMSQMIQTPVMARIAMNTQERTTEELLSYPCIYGRIR